MPVRMSEADRVRRAERARVFIANIRLYGQLHCPLCDQPIDHNKLVSVNHIIARSAGGDRKDFSNFMPTHPGCNSRKCNLSIYQVFGSEAVARVDAYRMAVNGRLTEADHQAAMLIFKAEPNWAQRIEAIYDWVHLGLLPMPPSSPMHHTASNGGTYAARS